MEEIIRYIGEGCIGIGIFLMVTGALGILRMPDFYTRLHPAGIIDALGAPLVLTGIMLLTGASLLSWKIIILLFFMFLTGPTATHALAKAAFLDGKKRMEDKQK